MGGYGALINGLRFRERFSKIGMLSPALGFHPQEESGGNGFVPDGDLTASLGPWNTFPGSYKDDQSVLRQALASGGTVPELFLGIGQGDPLYSACVRFREDCMALGQKLNWYEAEGLHDHTFWKQAMDPLFAFLTGKEGV